MKIIFAAGISFLLMACSGQGSNSEPVRSVINLEPSEFDILYADEAVPNNLELAELYERSCISCHSLDGAGAPLTGHTQDWEARLTERGMSGLIVSTKEGRGGMPAMGQCMDCSDADFEALIEFMATRE